jgi:hypothetical protein
MYHATKMGIEGFKAGGNVEVIRKPSPLRARGLETGLWEVVKRALLGAVSNVKRVTGDTRKSRRL